MHDFEKKDKLHQRNHVLFGYCLHLKTCNIIIAFVLFRTDLRLCIKLFVSTVEAVPVMRTKSPRLMSCIICNWTIIQSLGPTPRRGTLSKSQESQSSLTTLMMNWLLRFLNNFVFMYLLIQNCYDFPTQFNQIMIQSTLCVCQWNTILFFSLQVFQQRNIRNYKEIQCYQL